ATDNRGGAVRELHVAFSGAHTEAPIVVSGETLTRAIGEEGTTTVAYFAADYVGNEEPGQTLTIKIDRTAPTVTGLPDASCALGPANGRVRHVATVSAIDALSGIASGSLRVQIDSSESPNADDIVVTPEDGGSLGVWLRAKRTGHAAGLVYSLTAAAADLAG